MLQPGERRGSLSPIFGPVVIVIGCQLAILGSDLGHGFAQVPPSAPALIEVPSVSAAPVDVDGLGGGTIRLGEKQALGRSQAARRAARQLERAESPDCVDRYYEATVFAYAAMLAPSGSVNRNRWVWDRAVRGYHENLADCLRTAGVFGRLDPRSHLFINGPDGLIVVRVTHRGFVWSPHDFEALVDARDAPKNPEQHRSHRRVGLGAPFVSVRENRRQSPSDRFLPARSYFPATAVLRPDLGPWTGGLAQPMAGSAPGDDVLELLDPLRVPYVELAGSRFPLASNLDAPIALAEASVGSRRFAAIGLLNPSTEIGMTALGLIEPYQPGKIPVVFTHGLRSNPYTFTDMINGLRSRPGFLDHYQVAVFQYPTGITFIRSAAMFRRSLRQMEATFDPQHRDPGLQNTVLVGHSMGGLISKLQITWSGDALWNLGSTQPLETLKTSEATRSFLREIFFFEPLPFVRRVVFIGTPHDGAAMATRAVGRVTSRLIQRAPESLEMIEQLRRDNPGAIQPYLTNLPTSIDLLARRGPILETMRQLPINPATTYHTIAGTAGLPPQLARGDSIVPITSARSEGAASELLIPAVHTTMNASPYAIDEVDRILKVHRAEARP